MYLLTVLELFLPAFYEIPVIQTPNLGGLSSVLPPIYKLKRLATWVTSLEILPLWSASPCAFPTSHPEATATVLCMAGALHGSGVVVDWKWTRGSQCDRWAVPFQPEFVGWNFDGWASGGEYVYIYSWWYPIMFLTQGVGTCIMTYLHYFSLFLSILVYFILLEWAVLYKSLMDPCLLFRWFILCLIRDLINLWSI